MNGAKLLPVSHSLPDQKGRSKFEGFSKIVEKTLRICIIGNATSVHVANRALAFVRRGHEVILISEKPAAINGLIIRCPRATGMRGFKTFKMLRELFDFLLDANADIYHVHYAASYGAWLLASCGLRPLVVSVMGGDILPDEQTPQNLLVRWLTRQTVRGADMITSKSNYLSDRLIKLGVEPERIFPMIWGVDLDVFKRQDSSSLRRKLEISAEVPVVLSSRLLQPFYNIHLLIDAFTRVLDRHPNSVLVVTGLSPDGEYRQRLIDQTRELEIDKSVRFVGAVDYQDMPGFYSLADIAVSLAPSDGMPLSVLEALACETPSIITRLRRYEELFRHGENAWMVELDAASISEAISLLIEDPKRRLALCKNGRQFVRERADFAANTVNLEKTLEALTSSPEPFSQKNIPVVTRWVMRITIIVVAITFGLIGQTQRFWQLADKRTL